MYIHTITNFIIDHILPLYISVGWSNYTKDPSKLLSAYTHSLYIAGAYMEDTLVGLIRVVGDGVSVILIQDILVHPDYQHQHIGTSLMQHVLDKYQDVYQIQLLTDNTEATKKFYTSLGFTETRMYGILSFLKIQK